MNNQENQAVEIDVFAMLKTLWTVSYTHLDVYKRQLEAIVDRVIAEILERFPNGVKIYEIQNCLLYTSRCV